MKECEDIWANVTWTGLIRKDKLCELYAISDIGVMPSFSEQCSYVAIEMMMHGLPIIGNASTGLKEMIVDGETGLHIPVIEHPDKVEIDSSLLVAKMLYLLQNPEERKRMSVNARKRYEQVYSSYVFCKKMIKFYQSLFHKLSVRKTNNNIHTPPVSVVLPVHNCQQYISQAIDSILQQTMDDFELIIIDDASTDDTVSIINSYQDKRIKLFKNQYNLGNYPSRNLGMKNSVGKYIAVMDADDVCMPDRLEKQVKFMEVNREIGISASAVRLSTGEEISLPSNTAILKVLFLQENYLKHPSLIFRKQLFEKHHLYYNEQYRYSADYDLLVRAFRHFPVTAMQDILLTYRIHPGQITSEYRYQQWEYANQIRINQLHHLKIQPTDDEVEIHLSLLQKKKSLKAYSEKDYISWTEKLITHNNTSSCFHPSVFSDFLHNLLNNIIIV